MCRISRDRPDGGHHVRAHLKRMSRRLPSARVTTRAALGAARRAAHDPADVALRLAYFFAEAAALGPTSTRPPRGMTAVRVLSVLRGRPRIPHTVRDGPAPGLVMAWIILFFAGLTEVGWAVGLKYTEGFTRLVPRCSPSPAWVSSAARACAEDAADRHRLCDLDRHRTIGTALLGISCSASRERAAARLHRADRCRDRRAEAGVGGVITPAPPARA